MKTKWALGYAFSLAVLEKCLSVGQRVSAYCACGRDTMRRHAMVPLAHLPCRRSGSSLGQWARRRPCTTGWAYGRFSWRPASPRDPHNSRWSRLCPRTAAWRTRTSSAAPDARVAALLPRWSATPSTAIWKKKSGFIDELQVQTRTGKNVYEIIFVDNFASRLE